MSALTEKLASLSEEQEISPLIEKLASVLGSPGKRPQTRSLWDLGDMAKDFPEKFQDATTPGDIGATFTVRKTPRRAEKSAGIEEFGAEELPNALGFLRETVAPAAGKAWSQLRGALPSVAAHPLSRFAVTTAAPAMVSAYANKMPPQIIPSTPATHLPPQPGTSPADTKTDWRSVALGLGVPLAALGAAAMLHKKKKDQDDDGTL